jgi:hypothetical protein
MNREGLDTGTQIISTGWHNLKHLPCWLTYIQYTPSLSELCPVVCYLSISHQTTDTILPPSSCCYILQENYVSNFTFFASHLKLKNLDSLLWLRIDNLCRGTAMFVQGGSNMTGTNCDLFTHNQSRSYLNHLVLLIAEIKESMTLTCHNGCS